MSGRNTGLHERIRTILAGWKQCRPHKIYGGLSLDDFMLRVAPGIEAKAEAAEHDARAREARARGREADKLARRYVQRVVNSVKGDPDDGEDSEVYAAMGYVLRSVRDRVCGVPRKDAAKFAAKAESCPNPTDSRKKSAG